jgi:hypothetical protein
VVVVAGEVESGVTTAASARGVSPTGAVSEWLESRALYIAAVAAVAVVSLAEVYLHIAQDTWLAVLAGRLIAAHGVPHHDYLTVMAHGARWIDQQWLAQLGMYEVFRIGGLALMSVLYVALTAASLALGIAAARSLGATERALVMVLPIGAFFYIVTAVSVRTQGLAYPLFALTLWLLASEARSATRRRVFLVFPVLVVWANLHGSVTLGVGLAVLYGLVTIGGGVRARGRRGAWNLRGLAFVLGAPLTLLATPYGTGVIHYYSVTLLNSQFSKLVTEWRPVTSVMLLAVPYLLLLVAIVWLLGRAGRRAPTFDHLALVMLGLGGVFAVRNVTWFGLATVLLAPASLTHVLSDKPAAARRTRLNLTLATVSIAVAALAVVSTLAQPAAWFERTYDQRAVGTVAKLEAQRPGVEIFADVRFADWLIWHDPGLAGRLAYDTSFELLTATQLRTLAGLGTTRAPGQADPLARYGILVLDPENKASNRRLLDRPGVRIVLKSKRVIVAVKPVT